METDKSINAYARKRVVRKRSGKGLRKSANLIEINPPNISLFGNGPSNPATDCPRPVVSITPNYSGYSPLSSPLNWDPRYFAENLDSRLHSSFPPDNQRSCANWDTYNPICNNENRHNFYPLPMNSWKPTGDLLKNEERFSQDMKIIHDYVQSKNVPPDDEQEIFFDTLRRLCINYVQGLLKERDHLKSLEVNAKTLKENCDFIIDRLDSMLNVFRLANGAIGISEKQQKALLSSGKVLEAIKSQLFDCDTEYIDYSSTSPSREVSSPTFNQEQKEDLEEAKKEVYMLLEQLAGTQDELKKVRKELKDLMDVVKLKDLETQLSEIRAIKCKSSDLLKKSFSERLSAEKIISDIKLLIKDKIDFQDVEKHDKVPETAHSSNVLNVTENEVHLVTMIASFLRTVSFSVSLDFIYSYVEKVDNALSRQYVESLLKKYSTFFKEESVGSGSEWSYVELKPVITI